MSGKGRRRDARQAAGLERRTASTLRQSRGLGKSRTDGHGEEAAKGAAGKQKKAENGEPENRKRGGSGPFPPRPSRRIRHAPARGAT